MFWKRSGVDIHCASITDYVLANENAIEEEV